MSVIKNILYVTCFLMMGFASTVFAKGTDQPDSSQLYPKSIALVVGVNQSGGDWAPLSSAEDDAKRFARHLQKRGFEVTLLLGDDAKKSEILRQLQTDLPKHISAQDRFIFYFAGHGQTQVTTKGAKVGYIIPSDGQRDDEGDQWHTYLSMRELKDLLTQHIDSKHTLLLFDSCFSGMMFTRGGLRRASLGAKAHLKLKGVMALTAGSDQELAVDGLFTPTLIQALSGEADTNQDDVISFQELALYTRREISARQERQNPQFGIISGGGQMIFERTPAEVSIKPFAQPYQEVAKPLPPPEENWGGVVALSGAAITLVGTGLIIHGYTRNQALNQRLNGIDDRDEFNRITDRDFGSISAEYTSGWILGSVGLLTLGYGMYQWLSPPAATDQSAATLTPLLSDRSIGFAYTW